MPNWSNNVIAVKGNTTKVIDWLKTGVKNMPTDLSIDNLAEWLNKQEISLDNFNPMPQIFHDWDTTNNKRDIQSWFVETLFRGCGFYNGVSPITLPKEVEKHFMAYARPLLGFKHANFIGMKRIFRKINETTRNVYKFAVDYMESAPDEIMKLITRTYNKYSEGYNQAAKEQKAIYGVVGWYDWGLQYRGTKWNANLYDWSVEVSEDGKECIIFVCCETAWSMPEGWLATMQKNNNDLTFFVRGDEEAQFFNGYACARNLDEWVENDTNLYNQAKDDVTKAWEDEGRTTDEDSDDYNEDEFEQEVWEAQSNLSDQMTERFYEYVREYEVENEEIEN